MVTLIVAIYLIGLAGTAVALRKDRAVEAGRVVETTCSVLWPLYWGVIYFCAYRDRKRTR